MTSEPVRQREDLDLVIQKWEIRAGAVERAHFRRCALFRNFHLELGGAAVVFTSLLGVSTQLPQDWTVCKTVTIVLTVVAPVLTGLVSFLRFDEKSSLHHSAAGKFAAMKRKLQLMHVEASSVEYDIHQARRELFRLCDKWDTLTNQAPALYEKDAYQVLREIDKNEKALGLIDKNASVHTAEVASHAIQSTGNARPVLVSPG
jgi:Na+/phosphate symporter